MKYLIIILIFFTSISQAFDEDKVKHFAIAFGTQKGMYWIYKDAFKMNPIPARLFATFATTFVCLVKEGMDRETDAGDLVADGLGILSANVFNLKFNF